MHPGHPAVLAPGEVRPFLTPAGEEITPQNPPFQSTASHAGRGHSRTVAFSLLPASPAPPLAQVGRDAIGHARCKTSCTWRDWAPSLSSEGTLKRPGSLARLALRKRSGSPLWGQLPRKSGMHPKQTVCYRNFSCNGSCGARICLCRAAWIH